MRSSPVLASSLIIDFTTARLPTNRMTKWKKQIRRGREFAIYGVGFCVDFEKSLRMSVEGLLELAHCSASLRKISLKSIIAG
jgi:hypothetical protein